MMDTLLALTPAKAWNLLNALAFVAFLVGLVLSTAFGAFRLGYQKVTGRPLPRTRVVVWVEIALEMLPNLLGSVNKARAARGEPLFEVPAAPALPAAPPAANDG